jgi:hypothetical protein
MSSLTIPSSATAGLPAVNVHPHGHGHKKDSLSDLSTDSSDSSSTAAQIPVASAQNLFGSLFNSLQQLIGARPTPSAADPASASNTNAASGAIAAAAPKINLMA